MVGSDSASTSRRRHMLSGARGFCSGHNMTQVPMAALQASSSKVCNTHHTKYANFLANTYLDHFQSMRSPGNVIRRERVILGLRSPSKLHRLAWRRRCAHVGVGRCRRRRGAGGVRWPGVQIPKTTSESAGWPNIFAGRQGKSLASENSDQTKAGADFRN